MEKEILNSETVEVSCEEATDALDLSLEGMAEDLADLEALDGAGSESAGAKMLQRYAALKNRCVSLAKTGAIATKNGVLVAKDRCVGVAKSGARLAKTGAIATKNGVLVAKDSCVSGARTVASTAKILKTNPHFKQIRTYRLEMRDTSNATDPIDSIEISREHEFSARSLAIASGIVVATAVTAGILIGTLLDD